jgi:hypothetical protein
MSPTATEGRHGPPVVNVHTGEVLHEQERFGKEAIAERRDEKQAKYRRRAGKTPLVFDNGRTSAQ